MFLEDKRLDRLEKIGNRTAVLAMLQLSRGRRLIHTIGLLRAEVKLTLQNLAYNMRRFCIISTK